MSKTIDVSDLCSESLDLEHYETFCRFRDAFINKVFLNDMSAPAEILTDISLTENLDDFMKQVSILDDYYQSENIHFITCL